MGSCEFSSWSNSVAKGEVALTNPYRMFGREGKLQRLAQPSAKLSDGSTYQEAIANAEVVIKEWIETAKELGRRIPEP